MFSLVTCDSRDGVPTPVQWQSYRSHSNSVTFLPCHAFSLSQPSHHVDSLSFTFSAWLAGPKSLHISINERRSTVIYTLLLTIPPLS